MKTSGHGSDICGAVPLLAVLRTPLWRRVCLTLATLAVAMKVLAPPGFMVAPAHDRAFDIVLCTGHGPVTTEFVVHEARGDPAGKAPAGPSKHDAPCAFSGHGHGVSATDLAASGPAGIVRYAALAPVSPRPLPTPGRGLAAPPLPARGPPLQLI